MLFQMMALVQEKLEQEQKYSNDIIKVINTLETLIRNSCVENLSS